ncbi:MAG: zinc ABC transporter substrate-binding protein [Chloroflexota bacterium]
MRKIDFVRKIMVTSVLLLILLPVVLSGLSCVRSTGLQEKMIVAVSILPQSEPVEAIGGEKVSVMVMVPPGHDPHTYEPKPSQMRALADAALYLKLGSGLAFELAYLDRLIDINKKMAVCDLSQGIQLIKSTEADAEGGADPHIWLSPLNAGIMGQNACNCMVEIDPTNKVFYEENCAAYIGKLTQLDKDIREGLAQVKNRRFMVLHPAWVYFARDYNLEEIAIEVEGKEPSAQDMAGLIDTAKEYQIKIIFVSP